MIKKHGPGLVATKPGPGLVAAPLPHYTLRPMGEGSRSTTLS